MVLKFEIAKIKLCNLTVHFLPHTVVYIAELLN